MSLPTVPWTPSEDRLILKPIPNPDKSKGGLYIPIAAKGLPTTGIVLAAGPGKYQNGVFIPVDIKVGWKVMFPESAGVEFDIDGETFRTIRSTDVIQYDPDI